MGLPEGPIRIHSDFAIKRDEYHPIVLLSHPELDPVNLTCFLESWKPLSEESLLLGNKEVTEPVPNNLMVRVSEGVKPGIIDINESPVVIKRLVWDRRLAEEDTKPFFSLN